MVIESNINLSDCQIKLLFQVWKQLSLAHSTLLRNLLLHNHLIILSGQQDSF